MGCLPLDGTREEAVKDGRFCSHCLGFFSEDQGHTVGELFFCGPADNSICAFDHFKWRAAMSAMRAALEQDVRYDVCQRGPYELWYVRVDKVDYGNYERDEALRMACHAARSDFRRGHDVGVWISEGSAIERVF